MKLNIEELAKQAGATKERDETFGPAYEFEIHQLKALVGLVVERCAQEAKTALDSGWDAATTARIIRNLMED